MCNHPAVLVVRAPNGEDFNFRSTSLVGAAWTSRPILEGRTYPALQLLTDVRTVVDVGANCGAASVYFALNYPDATVHAVEPGSEQLECLRANASWFPTIQVHPVGLSDESRNAELHLADDTGQSSVFRSEWHSGATEPITLLDAGEWADAQGITRIDVLKVDVELSELDVLKGFARFLPEVSVIYLEFGSRVLRREIDRLLDPTHDLLLADMSLDHGECTYLRRDLADHPDLPGELVAIVGRRLNARDA